MKELAGKRLKVADEVAEVRALRALARTGQLPLATNEEFQAWLLGVTRNVWQDCQACPLSAERRNVVFGSGSPTARLFVVGEAPGEVEDETAIPFSGPSGAIVRRVLRLLGLDPEVDCWITNMVACRPPANRRPHAPEIQACSGRLRTQVTAIAPQVILLLGGTASGWADKQLRPTKDRGVLDREVWPDVGPDAKRNLKGVVLAVHPSYILRQDSRARRRVELNRFTADLRRAVKLLD